MHLIRIADENQCSGFQEARHIYYDNCIIINERTCYADIVPLFNNANEILLNPIIITGMH